MTNPVAYLYGRHRTPIGAAGVAVAPDLVVFSPWPSELTPGTAFRVRIMSYDGAAEWHQPLGVDYARLSGARESTNIAIVNLLDPLRQPVQPLRGVPVDAVVAALRASGSRAAMTSLAPEELGRLGRRLAAPAVAGDETPPKALVPQTYLVRTGPPDVVQRSLCRIFRWD